MYKAMKAIAILAVALMTTVCAICILTDGTDAATAWDGTTDIGWYNESDTTFEISTAEQLAGLAVLVNDQHIDFTGKTIILAAEIDLAGQTWTPIGKSTSYPFTGTFDGNEQNITNLTVSSSYAGLFGCVESGVLENIILSNVTVTFSSSMGFVGALAAVVQNGTAVSNCTVESGSVTSSARMLFFGTGGLIGNAKNSTGDIPVTIDFCKNYATVTGGGRTGGIVGVSSADISNCENHGAVKVNQSESSVGGIVGEQEFYGTIYNCDNYASITSEVTNDSDYSSAGGILGWARYYTGVQDSTIKSSVTVIDCHNHSAGTVTANNNMVGGIVGCAFHSITVVGCVNDAAVTGTKNTENYKTSFVSGIIGGTQTYDENHNKGADGCRIVIMDNTNNGKVNGAEGGTNIASIAGQLANEYDLCDVPKGEYVTFAGNTDTANEGMPVSTGNDTTTVAVIVDTDETGVETLYGYSTLAAAVDDAPEGIETTIRIVDDALLTGETSDNATTVVPSGKIIVLDINGKSITVTEQNTGRHFYAIDVHGDLTITDSSNGNGKIEARGVQVYSGGHITLESGEIVSIDNGGGAAVFIDGSGEFVMNGGKLSYIGQPVNNISGTGITVASASGVATINTGTIESSTIAISAYGTTVIGSENGNVIISGGTNYFNVIKAYSGSDVTITNAEITAEYGGCIEVTGGQVSLTNTTMEQTGFYDHNSMCIAVSNGASVNIKNCNFKTENYGFYVFNSGGLITIDGGTYEATGSKGLLKADDSSAGSNIEVKGGTFIGKVVDGDGGSGDDVRIQISGGTFSQGFDQRYVVPDNGVFQKTDGTWGIFESVIVTFNIDGKDPASVEVRKGFPVDSDNVPVPEEAGKEYTWKSNGKDIDPYTHKFTADTTLIADPMPVDAEFTVTFMDGDELVGTLRTVSGGSITPPEVQSKTGLVFEGWMNGEAAADFSSVTENMTVTASWEPAVPVVTITQDPANPEQGGTVTLTAVVTNDGTENDVTYTYTWNGDAGSKTHPVTSNGTYKVVVTASYGGKTATSDEASIVVTFQEPEPEPSTVPVTVKVDQDDAVITISGYTGTVQNGVPVQLSPGTYTVTATKEGFETYTKIITVSDKSVTLDVTLIPSESDTPVSPPSGDDDEDLPPIIRPGTSTSSGDDDTVTIVACAAAAAVAAILAVFLIMAYRKD